MIQHLAYHILFITSFLGILGLAILLYRNRVRSYHIEPLIISLAGITIWVFHRFLMQTGLILEVPHLFRVSAPPAMLIAPMAYLYTRALLKDLTNWQKSDWVHFLPAVGEFFFLIPFFLKNSQEKRAWLEMLYAEPALFGQFMESVLGPYMQNLYNGGISLSYVGAAYLIIVRYLENMPLEQRKKSKAVIFWMMFYVISLGILSIVVLLSFLFDFLPVVHFYRALNYLVALLVFVLLILLFFQPAVLYGVSSQEYEKTKERADEGHSTNPYGLSYDQIEDIAEKVQKYFEQERRYLEPDFTLLRLAEHINVPRHHISYAINQGLGVNFNELVNSYRIEYCLRDITIEDWNSLTIEGVGKKLGFHNRGTFSRAFKKATGKSPSAYRREKLQQEK